ncbi:hypothetical protein R1sor_015431 [Riccia sorocarpa]|uniref:Fucosyltransferase n=1 Tax=Riccia sorocarpa TaxID=122646 RepID=A0ABD3HEX7_9MARC
MAGRLLLRNFSSHRMWMKAAMLIGSMLVFLALQLILHLDVSWTQHMAYRPSTQSIPISAPWEKAFRNYENFHARCSEHRNWTRQFLEATVESNRSNSHRRFDNCRVLVYVEGGAGMGNRLLSLVSAFLYSLLTKRVFLLDSRGNLPKLLCEPFSNSSWVLPFDFPFKALDEAATLRDFGKATAVSKNSSAQVVRLQLDHDQSVEDGRFFCIETRESLQFVSWLVWTSNQYYVPRFFTFPELWQPLKALFPNVTLTFTHLSRSLLLPSNSLWEKVTRIYSSYLSQADWRLGIQIRRHSVSDKGRYDEPAFDRVLSCLISQKFLPNIEFGNNISSRQETRNSRIPRHVNHAVLVTSLQVKFFEKLRDLYSNTATVDGSLVRLHMVSHEGVEWHSFDQDEKAFIEMWLLSLSDRIATSSFSTFGYIAQGLGAMRPLLVELRGEISEQMSMEMSHVCYIGQSIEPCNHFPFYPTRSQCAVIQTARSNTHLAWIRRNLLPCQDLPQGLQLVS